jgi:hypothetical protein
MLLASPPAREGHTDDADKPLAPSAATKEKRAEREGCLLQQGEEKLMALHARWRAGIC